MAKKTMMIRLRKEDVEKMRHLCRDRYLDAYPERKGKILTDQEIFASMVRFYLN